MHSISTVLLDAGGVLINETNQEAARRRSVVDAINTVKPDYALADYDADVATAVAGFHSNVYEFIIEKNTESSSNPAAVLEAERRFFEQSHPPLVLAEGIAQELHVLSKDFDLVMAGQYGNELLVLLEKYSLTELFKNRLTQDDFDITKPNPEYYRLIAARADVSLDACIMVGDRIDKDIIPAKSLGMKTIRIRWGLHRNQNPRSIYEQPDLELTSVVGLADAVRILSGYDS